MRNKILAVAILFLCSGSIFAKDTQKSLFNCLDLGKYSVDENCTSSLISTNSQFITLQKELSIKMEQQNPNEMATVQFHPQQMLIKVIAQRQKERKSKLIAAVQSNKADASIAL